MKSVISCTRKVALLCTVLALALAPSSAQKWNRYGPGTRSQASAIYDATTNQMIMFAGQHAPTSIDFNDLWSVSNVIPSSSTNTTNLSWSKVNVLGKAPSLRFGHSAVYNPTNSYMIVFGGGTGFPGPCANDLYVLKNANAKSGTPTWSQLSPTGTAPAVREGHVAVYDSVNNKMIVFGGTNCNSGYYNDLWILSNADGTTGTPSWSQVTPVGTAPAARTQAAVIYDPVNNVMVMFGGHTSVSSAFNDIWTLTHANGIGGTPTWTNVVAAGTAPSARAGHSAVYDPTHNIMVVYGGINTHSTVLGESWALSTANNIGGTPAWSQITPTDTAPLRHSHTAIYDPVSNDMVIFGGDSEIPATFTDDHVFTFTKANGLQ